MGLLTENQLGDLLSGFSASAFRFEIRERYSSTVGQEPFRRFLAGEPDDYAWHRSWMERIALDCTQGRLWQRIRIVSVPLSDYSRYGIEVARLSVEAGEDIRYLRRDVAEDLGLAPLDAWIFDSCQVVHLLFNDDDTFRGAEIVTDDGVLTQHLKWRELALQHAQPLEDFVASVR
ncbi:DUF6879 family protein [Sphaerisporangium rhizosphaerae]|uniref:DUF6879 family protein n=1 Tax=Sphaerisporangium rhizosphaerae TaxID=2269375 RepID=A0ABW2NU24_9ACTN